MATLIYNVTDLQNMNLDLTAAYELANDIDASITQTWRPTTDRGEWQPSTAYAVDDYVLVSTYSPARTYLCKTAHTSGSSFATGNWDRIWVDIPAYLGFTPIAIGFAEEFSGSLDGNGYSINNLYINRPLDYAALIKRTNSATITNLRMSGVSATGLDFVGSLVATDRSWTGSTISDVRITGAVIAGDAWVGGFAGEHYLSTVTRCSVQGTVNAAPTVFGQYAVGGFVGYNHAIIDKCWADVDVATTDPSCEEVGGFVGLNTNNITNSYARGSVTSNDKVGGFVGYHRGTDAPIEKCYSTGLVTGNTNVGGFCGQNDETITNSFWDTQTSLQATSGGGTGKTTAEMKAILTFATWDIATTTTDRNDGYAFLSWEIGESGTIWLILAPLETPEVQTLPASKITETSARLNGRVINDGGGLCQYNFRYRLAFSGVEYTYTGWSWPLAGHLATHDYFNDPISGLTANTAYEFAAGVKNALDTYIWGYPRYFMTAGPGDDGDEESCYTIPDLYDHKGRVAKGSRVRAYRTDTGVLVSESTIDQYGTATLCGLPNGIDIRFIVNWGGIAQENKSRTFFRTAAQISEGGTGATSDATISDTLAIGATVSIWNLILGD